jgi:hypothetical protein
MMQCVCGVHGARAAPSLLILHPRRSDAVASKAVMHKGFVLSYWHCNSEFEIQKSAESYLFSEDSQRKL